MQMPHMATASQSLALLAAAAATAVAEEAVVVALVRALHLLARLLLRAVVPILAAGGQATALCSFDCFSHVAL